MNLVKENNCFHSRQLTLNNYLRYNDHITSCSTCMMKVKALLENGDILDAHFEANKIGEKSRIELLKDLENINADLYPNLLTRLKMKSLVSFKTVTKNFSIFLLDLISIRKITLIALAVAFIYLFR